MLQTFLVDFAILYRFYHPVGQLLHYQYPLVQKFSFRQHDCRFIAGTRGAGTGNLPFLKIWLLCKCSDYLIFAGVGINGFSFNKKDFKAGN